MVQMESSNGSIDCLLNYGNRSYFIVNQKGEYIKKLKEDRAHPSTKY
jgi:hypothetical protein